MSTVQLVRVDAIVSVRNPRKTLGDVTELAASIQQHGVLQPVGVRLMDDPDTVPGGVAFELVWGQRRMAAARLAGLTYIPAMVRRAGFGEGEDGQGEEEGAGEAEGGARMSMTTEKALEEVTAAAFRAHVEERKAALRRMIDEVPDTAWWLGTPDVAIHVLEMCRRFPHMQPPRNMKWTAVCVTHLGNRVCGGSLRGGQSICSACRKRTEGGAA